MNENICNLGSDSVVLKCGDLAGLACDIFLEDGNIQINDGDDEVALNRNQQRALIDALNCLLDTGSFAALADTSPVPFTGKQMRVPRWHDKAVECKVLGRGLHDGFWTVACKGGGLFDTKDDLLPLVEP